MQATRVERGLDLYRTRGEEIQALGRNTYRIPGDKEPFYLVNLREESCQCADYVYRLSALPESIPCKHIECAVLYRAKLQRGVAA